MSTDHSWAIILGASSGFGEAASIELSRHGYHICGVHLDRKGTLPHVQEVIDAIEKNGRKALFFNINAADPENRADALAHLKQEDPEATVKVLMHSLAFGTLKPLTADNPEDQITPAQMNMTLDVMAHSLVYWVQDLLSGGLLLKGSRIFAMTSSGSVMVAPSYGAVSAAKAALESHVRQLTLELGARGISVNAIRAGVTETPSSMKIPTYELMKQAALGRNPSGRITTPQDVAKVIALLSHPDAYWITGNVINVDGGEMVVGTK